MENNHFFLYDDIISETVTEQFRVKIFKIEIFFSYLVWRMFMLYTRVSSSSKTIFIVIYTYIVKIQCPCTNDNFIIIASDTTEN